MNFSFKGFFSKCEHVFWIYSHLLKKFLTEKLIGTSYFKVDKTNSCGSDHN